MIHTVIVDRLATPASLKKEFRKKLMTGGAVLSLSSELSEDDILELVTRFSADAHSNNLSELCLLEIAKLATELPLVRSALENLNSPKIQQALITEPDQISAGATDTKKRALIEKTKANLLLFEKSELAAFYFDNTGRDELSVINRIALSELQLLPEDILERLKVDVDPRVRVGVRSVPKILEAR
jgi:hypothetical protein